ncbi:MULTISPECIES: FAD-dependent oxidoreductase [unclassified Dehalobacter]|uniref:FAD-dependent oxidoreductase n=1 Tax=unclassified Dehalobacter TaxID=2635733 RepID=UPI000ECED815|nr:MULTISPECIES: FAD-dependent oxidoreductase [unclassified Dehalobacter]RJE47219.1 fumarate reductase [Dehalobacter sp. MCB1]
MKKWICTVCGYVHEGAEPPEKCPMCGAPKEKFQLLADPGQDAHGLNSPPSTRSSTFDDEADILIVGSGAAAFSAAITARKQGASVIMLEKASSIGGTTIRSGGGYWTPNNRFQRERGIEDKKEDALRYMSRYSYPHLYNPKDFRLGIPQNAYELIEAMYDRASETVEFLAECGALSSIQEINWKGKPQVDYMDHLPENKGVRGRVLYAKNPQGMQSYGFELIRQLEDWAKANGIKIMTDHQVIHILQNDRKEVVGLEVVRGGKEIIRFRARRAAIFGSGGYSHNSELMLHFQRGPHFGGCSAPTNTGDFITMSVEIGAKIGNMAGAFRAESILENALAYPGGSNNVFYIPGDSVIEVNRYGKRIMDEKRNYTDRAMTHFVWDPQRAEWTNMLVFMIYDQRTAELWQGFPPYPLQSNALPSYIISGATLEELTRSLSQRLSVLAEHTGGFGLAPDFLENLKNTVTRFNEFAKNGRDEDFHRGDYTYDREWTTFPPTVPGAPWPPEGSRNYCMYPLSDHGPYYAVILGAGTLDTNGGPVIDRRAQVLDVRGNPIPGLYGAGNCIASPTANAYWGAGSTIGPAMTFGHIAGIHAAAEPIKTVQET